MTSLRGRQPWGRGLAGTTRRCSAVQSSALAPGDSSGYGILDACRTLVRVSDSQLAGAHLSPVLSTTTVTSYHLPSVARPGVVCTTAKGARSPTSHWPQSNPWGKPCVAGCHQTALTTWISKQASSRLDLIFCRTRHGDSLVGAHVAPCVTSVAASSWWHQRQSPPVCVEW